MNSEMGQGSKRRRRKKQTASHGSTPTNQLTDLIESHEKLVLDVAQQQGSEGRVPFKVIRKRPSDQVTVNTAVRGHSKPQSATRSGTVVSNVPINTDVSKASKLTRWQDGEGKYHRIDSEHRVDAEALAVARTTESEANADEECCASASERTLLASDFTQTKQGHNQFAIEHPQPSSIDHEREVTLRSERLAITRERELLIQERELLVRERELLAADRKQFSLEFARRADREATIERYSTQSFELSAPMAGNEFENDSENASAAIPEPHSRMKGATPVAPLDIASLFGIERVELQVGDGGSQDDEVRSTAAEHRFFIDSQHRIEDLHCHSSQLPEPPAAPLEERSAASKTSATTVRIDAGPEAIETTIGASEERLGSLDESIDQLIARMLARSRTNTAEGQREDVRRCSTPSGPTTQQQTAVSEEIDLDSSSVSLEPSHKQDKQAVRGNLQLFRQVANSYARSALARHSSRQMRGIMMTKGVILSLSLSAAVLFLLDATPAGATNHWKGMSCGLVAMLTMLDIHRSWRKIRRRF